MFDRYNAQYPRSLRRQQSTARRGRLEPLEPRRLLALITEILPLPGSHAAAADTEIRVVFDGPLDAASVSLDSLVVNAANRGRLTSPDSNVRVDESTPTMAVVQPSQPFFPGEILQATATRSISDANGQPLVTPFVWEFRTTTRGGTGLFGSTSQLLGSGGPLNLPLGSTDVALGDLDADGDLDAVTVRPDAFPVRHGITVWLNDGTGQFQSDLNAFSVLETATLQAQTVDLGDMDGDGDLDVVLAGAPSSICCTDLDGDGTLDDVAGGSSVGVFLNDGSGHFSLHARAASSGVAHPVTKSALGDLNGDGYPDLFVTFQGVPEAGQVWLNDGLGGLAPTDQPFPHPMEIAELWGARFASASQLVLGDIDGDADLDAVIAYESCCTGDAAATLWLNNGVGHFELTDATIGRANNGVTAVELGDLDGDHDLDLVLGRPTRPADQGQPLETGFDEVWINDGTGRFFDNGQRLGLDGLPLPTRDLALGDLDADGDLDLYAANYGLDSFHGQPASDTVWFNDGSGRFTESGQRIANDPSRMVALGDLDGDGDLDAFTANWDPALGAPAEFDRVWRNLDDSSMKVDLEVALDVPQAGPYQNGDLLNVTLSVTNHGPDDLGSASVLLGFPDGLADVVWSCQASGRATCPPAGAGQVDEEVMLPVDGSVHFTATLRVDFENPFAGGIPVTGSAVPLGGATDLGEENNQRDAWIPVVTHRPLEVIAAPRPNSIDAGASAPILVQFGDPLDTASVTGATLVVHAAQSGSLSPAATVAADGHLAVLAPGRPLHAGERVQVTLTEGVLTSQGTAATFPSVWEYRVAATAGHGTFVDSGRRIPASAASGEHVVGDFDGDGDLDVAVASDGTTTNRIWLNGPDGTLVDAGQTFGDLPTVDLAAGDLDGDGDLDLVETVQLPNSVEGRLRIWLNDGAAHFIPGSSPDLVVDVGSPLGLADLDGDGDLDLVASINQFGFETTTILINDGVGAFAPTAGLGDRYVQVAIADVTGGGGLDLVFVASGYLWVHSSDGSAQFPTGAPNQPSSVATGDLDGDGDVDLVVGSLLSGDPATTWLNDGKGSFSRVGAPFGTHGVVDIELADIDADGNLDAMLGHAASESQPPLGVWLNDGEGRFEPNGQILAELGNKERAVAGLTAADMDGDGAIDLLVAVQSTDAADVLLLANDAEIPPISGDFNRNGSVEQGDLDLVLLHWGELAELPPDGWIGAPPTGAIDQQELDAVLLNWGNAVASGFSSHAPLHTPLVEPSETDSLSFARVPARASSLPGGEGSGWRRVHAAAVDASFTELVGGLTASEDIESGVRRHSAGPPS